MSDSRSYRAINIALLGSMGLGGLIVYTLPFWRRVLGITPVCLFEQATGHPCPLCGMTTALYMFMKGHIVEGLSRHPLAALVLLLLAFELVSRLLLAVRPPANAPAAAIRRVDGLLHRTLGLLYLVYAAGFLLLTAVRAAG